MAGAEVELRINPVKIPWFFGKKWHHNITSRDRNCWCLHKLILRWLWMIFQKKNLKTQKWGCQYVKNRQKPFKTWTRILWHQKISTTGIFFYKTGMKEDKVEQDTDEIGARHRETERDTRETLARQRETRARQGRDRGETRERQRETLARQKRDMAEDENMNIYFWFLIMKFSYIFL